MNDIKKNLTNKIRRDFDRLAFYDIEQWNHNNHYHSFLLEHLPIRCKTILDIGCGVGEFSRLLANRTDKVTAIDLSPNSIKIAKQRSKQFNNIDYLVADVSQWEFPPEHFEAIVSIATVHHLSLAKLLPKIKASLKPGGVLIILDLLDNRGIEGLLSDCIAIPFNWWFIAKNKPREIPLEAKEAMREHQKSDRYLNLSQVKNIYNSFLTTPKIRKHLFWRYSVVWQK